jgi:FtsP/CotA-like multicopper oxidase with cupredoxin domain
MLIDRRKFLVSGLGGTASIVTGCTVDPILGAAGLADGASPGALTDGSAEVVVVDTLNLHITDILKDIVTHNAINTAQCYFWTYKEDRLPADGPGPMIFMTEGESIKINVTNELDEPHSFVVPGMVDSGPIPPGATVSVMLTPMQTGTFLYYDNLNAPVNRVMGLHGALIVMPSGPQAGHEMTPYSRPTAAVQRLFDNLGTAPWWPGLSWEDGDPSTDTPPLRQNVWLMQQASPVLFAQVGSLAPGEIFDADEFVAAFLRDRFTPDTKNNRTPQYFTINGQSGHFSHNNPYITPFSRVGEPTLIRALNAGLWTLSNHIHANHVYLLALNGVVQENAIWVDTFTQFALETFDWLIPFMRPPDVPNAAGVGRGGSADKALLTLASELIPGSAAHEAWPPIEELNTLIPGPARAMGSGIPDVPLIPAGTPDTGAKPMNAVLLPGVPTATARDQQGNVIDLAVRLSLLCYPMHDHSEPTQTAQGGNYLCGTLSGLLITGDRNHEGGIVDFPDRPTVHGPGPKGVFRPALNSGKTGTQVSINAKVGQTVLVRALCAAYANTRISFPMDAVIIAFDGRALGVPPFGLYNNAFLLPAGTPIEIRTARRLDALMMPTEAMNTAATVQFVDTRGLGPGTPGRVLVTAKIPFVVA